MLKVVTQSKAAKVNGCAATYRAGGEDVFGTCPTGCPLLPAHRKTANTIDNAYVEMLTESTPRKGRSFLYSHFDYKLLPNEGATVFNFSADRPSQMVEAFEAGHPTVLILPKKREAKVYKIEGVKVVGCPGEYANVTCKDCNLCMRHKRDFVVGFHAHGKAWKLAQNPDVDGGCFAWAGVDTRSHWEGTRTSDRSIDEMDLKRWVRSLPRGTTLRHHIAGDIGKQSPSTTVPARAE